uniref:Uncharacterized protein n=1 Tax=Arundo donax TaxID=35708 RepID=A0A0A9AFP7_ARUDO
MRRKRWKKGRRAAAPIDAPCIFARRNCEKTRDFGAYPATVSGELWSTGIEKKKKKFGRLDPTRNGNSCVVVSFYNNTHGLLSM